jgi:hypothetical protein
MNIEQLEQALDRYGGDLARWPAALRAEAEMMMAASDPRAAELIAAVSKLDGALAEAMRPMSMDAALIGRIVSGIGTMDHRDLIVRPTRRLIAWASAATVAFLVTGYAVGIALPASQGEDAFAGLMFGNSASTTIDSDSGSVL